MRASLAGGWEFVIEARGEKDIASVGTAVEYTHQGLTASIGVEARKDGREKTVDIRPGVKFKATDKALADLVSGEKTAEAKPRRDEARAYRLDFARMMKFPQRNRFEIDPHRTFDEHGVRAIAVKK